MLWQPQSQCIYADKWAMSLLYQPRQPNLLSKSDWKDTHRSVHPNPITSRSSACRVRNVIVDRSRRRIVVVAWVCLVEWLDFKDIIDKESRSKQNHVIKLMWSRWRYRGTDYYRSDARDESRETDRWRKDYVSDLFCFWQTKLLGADKLCTII